MADEPLRLAVLPEYEHNPYQHRLVGAMPADQVVTRWHGAAPRWLATLEEFGADVAHFHWLDPYVLSGPLWKSATKALLFKRQLAELRRRGVAVVWTCHNLTNHRGRHPRLERWAIRRAAPLFDRVIVHDESSIVPVAEAFGVADPERRIAVIPHAAFGDVYPEGASREATRASLGLGSDDAVFLLFGALQPRKRVLESVRAFGRVADERARLLVVGKGEPAYVAQVEAAAAADPRVVVQARFVEDAEVRPLHAAADIVVLPYGAALTSGALVLAMELGKPVVCTPFGHALSVVGDEGGLFLTGDDEPAIAAGLEAMLARRAQWPAMGERNHRHANQQTWRTMAEQTLACYREAIVEARARQR